MGDNNNVDSWGFSLQRGVNRGMQIRQSVPFFRQIRQSATIFVQIRKVNVNATVTINSAQIVKKVTCLMTITQYNSNNSLTAVFKWAFSKKINNLDELINIPTKAEERAMVQVSIMTQDQTSRQAQSGIHAKIHSWSTIHKSARFLRPNLSIRKPIHPPLYITSWLYYLDLSLVLSLYTFYWFLHCVVCQRKVYTFAY